MKKSDVLTLANAGVLNATQHTLSSAHSYRVFKFKSLIRKEMASIQEAESELLKELGLEDAGAFDARLAELRQKENPTAKEKEELDEKTKQLKDFIEQRNQLYKEEVTLDLKTIPYEEWRNLQDENKAVDFMGRKADVFSGDVEELLFGVLWKAPEEDWTEPEEVE